MRALADNLPADVLLTLVLFAGFAWACRRGLLLAREAAWVGAALVFFGVSLAFNAVLTRNGPLYPHLVAKLVGVSVLMTLPLLLTLGGGVYALARSLVPQTLQTVQIGGLALHLVRGPLAAFAAGPPLDTLLLPTSTDFRPRGSQSESLRAFAGPLVAAEAAALAPLPIGQAVRTNAGSLHASHLVYAPVQDTGKPAAEADAKRALDAALRCAKQNAARRVALPPFGVPLGKLSPSACAALTVAGVLRARKELDFAAVVVLDKRLLPAFQSEFRALAAKHPAPPSV